MFAFYLIIVVLLGLAVGSFVNVCIYRMPEGKSVVSPPSACMYCGTQLRPLDLIPVFSFLLLRGRCRYCGKSFSARYMLVELLTAAVFAVLYLKYGFSVQFFALAYLAAILVAVLFIDTDHRIIPDELVLAGLAGGALITVYNIFFPQPIYGDDKWWNPLMGILPGSGTLLVVALIGAAIYKTDDALGMGDVKLFAPIGIFLGWRLCIVALFFSILFAGVTSLVLMAFKLKKKRDTIAFGPFIVAATLAVCIWGWDILNWYINRL